MAVRTTAPSKRKDKTHAVGGKSLPIIHGQEREYRPVIYERVMDPIDIIRRDMDLFFDDIFNGFGLWPLSRGIGVSGYSCPYTPPVDMTEDDRSIKVSAELPGLGEKDIEVRMTDDTLIISGEKKEEPEHGEKEVCCTERSYGAFRREIPIFRHVDTSKVEATFHNGVLNITLPKLESEKSRKVVVKSH